MLLLKALPDLLRPTLMLLNVPFHGILSERFRLSLQVVAHRNSGQLHLVRLLHALYVLLELLPTTGDPSSAVHPS